MLQLSPKSFPIRYQSDVAPARREAVALARELGFDSTAAEEIALVVIELGTNLLKHARGGNLVLVPLTGQSPLGLEIESIDHGPGIRDIEQAMADGFSTAGSRGTGLGAVNRLMDELDIASPPNQGTRIVCRKWLPQAAPSTRSCPLTFGIATRPHPGCRENGDAFILRQWDESALVGVIDGLGHGQFAHRAAATARHYVETHHDSPLSQIFLGVGRACRGTRGVVMALARFDWGRQRISFGSIGDIEARVFPRTERFAIPVQRGILGLNAPALNMAEHRWNPTNILVLHSDGLHTHWSLDDFPGLAAEPASEMATRLLRKLARGTDDATVLVVRGAMP